MIYKVNLDQTIQAPNGAFGVARRVELASPPWRGLVAAYWREGDRAMFRDSWATIGEGGERP